MMMMMIMMTSTDIKACSMTFQNNGKDLEVKQSTAFKSPTTPQHICETTEYPSIRSPAELWMGGLHSTIRCWKSHAIFRWTVIHQSVQQGKKFCPKEQENQLACIVHDVWMRLLRNKLLALFRICSGWMLYIGGYVRDAIPVIHDYGLMIYSMIWCAVRPLFVICGSDRMCASIIA